jgi:hypothetical protein
MAQAHTGLGVFRVVCPKRLVKKKPYRSLARRRGHAMPNSTSLFTIDLAARDIFEVN